MPKVKTVESLLNLGLKCAVEIIYFNKYSVRCDSQLDSIFVRQLPAHLLEKIVQRLMNLGALSHSLLHLLTSQLQDLNICFKHFFSVIPRMENLKILKITILGVDDSTLKNVGTYCKQLRDLHLLDTVSVTDAGILMLCFGAEYLDEEKRVRTKLCGTLQVLQLEFPETQLSKNAVQVALTNLSALRVFVNDLTLDVLAECAQNSVLNNSYLPRYSLVRLATVEKAQYLSGTLGLALSLCPFVSELNIYVKYGFKDSDLLSLMSLKTIRSLRLYKMGGDWSVETQITFEGGLVPLLKVIGCSLEILDLSCFQTFNIWTVVEFCPNLCSFFIDRFSNWRLHLKGNQEKSEEYPFKMEHWKKKNLILKKLKYLICCYDFPSDVLLFLLSSPSLVRVKITNCDMLTDDVFRDAAKFHQFQKLQSIELRNCNAVTNQGIDVFMSDDNPLNNISLWFCKKIICNNSKRELESIHLKKNWNLKTYVRNK